MQKFNFKLETVRKHRGVLEEQAMQAFASVQRELAACIARIAALQMEFQQVVSSRPRTFVAEELALRERQLDNLRHQIEKHERIYEGLTARMEDARQQLVGARQNRETVDRLRDVALLEHRKHAQKAEQDALDELASLRHGRWDRREQ